MPVFKSGEVLPTWCELDFFEIIRLAPGETHACERRSPKEKFIVGEGRCLMQAGALERFLARGEQFDWDGPGNTSSVAAADAACVVIRMCGRWGEEIGGSGLFFVVTSESPHDAGDPVDYPKRTNFDAHYHDCDEYWILYAGRGTAVSEGRAYAVGEGDVVATGMGHHHDFPEVTETVRAVFFETTLQGRKRRGHLWNHTHGAAEPDAARV